MKTHNKYRFSLQWGADTTAKIQAGEFINSLGNRKSEFLVTAVTEYITAHPEVLINGQKPQIMIKPSFTHKELENMVRAIVADMTGAIRPTSEKKDMVSESVSDDADISVMLDNLDAFLQ